MIRFWRDRRGVSSAEYAVLFAVIGTAVALAVTGLRDAAGTAVSQQGAVLATANPAGPAGGSGSTGGSSSTPGQGGGSSGGGNGNGNGNGNGKDKDKGG